MARNARVVPILLHDPGRSIWGRGTRHRGGRSMKRNVILGTIAVALLALLPAPARAAAPFGSFGGKVGGGNGASGRLSLQGWALDDSGIAAVDILVDGIVVGRAQYGRARPQVAAQHPGF